MSVLVSYASTQSLQSSENWKHFQSSLFSQLPLRSLHWKSAAKPSIRTIQELGISLVPLEGFRDELTSQIPTIILEKPFLNILIVVCDVSLPPVIPIRYAT